MNKLTIYYDLLISLCKDFEERCFIRGGDIRRVVVEEKFERRKYAREQTLVLSIRMKVDKIDYGEITKESSLFLKTDYYNELREHLAKRLIHNYFCFGLYKTFKDKENLKR